MVPVARLEERRRFSITFVVAAGIIYVLRSILLPFVAAFGLAYISLPIVKFIRHRLHLNSVVAVLVFFVLAAAIPGILWLFFGSEIVRSVQDLGMGAPDMAYYFIRNMIGADKVEVLGRTIRADVLANQLVSRLQEFLLNSMGITEVVGALARVVLNLVVMVVALFYFLVGAESLLEGAIGMAPPEKRGELRHLAGKIDLVLGRFLRGIAVIIGSAALISWFALHFAFNLPHAGLFALAIGFLEIIPGLGPILSGLLTSIGAFGSGGMSMAMKVIGFYIALRLTIDQILGPLVLGRAVTLPPLVVLFALFAGAGIFGLLGLLVAVPVTAVVKIVLHERNIA